MFVGILLQLLQFAHFTSAEVTVLSKVQTLYDRSPKLRIKVAGITPTDMHEVSIVIGAKGSSSLRSEKDFVLSKDDDNDGFVLKLLSQRK